QAGSAPGDGAGVEVDETEYTQADGERAHHQGRIADRLQVRREKVVGRPHARRTVAEERHPAGKQELGRVVQPGDEGRDADEDLAALWTEARQSGDDR